MTCEYTLPTDSVLFRTSIEHFLFEIFDYQEECENGAKVFVIVFVFMQTAIDGTGVVFV